MDHEFYLMQGEFYTGGPVAQPGLQPFSPDKIMREAPEYIVWKGRVGSLVGEQALKVRKGETVHLLIGNGGVAKPVHFHIIGEILDRVYVQGALNTRLPAS